VLFVAGRGLPLKEKALLYHAVSPVQSPAPNLPRDLCLIIYIYISFGRVLLPKAYYTLLDAGFPFFGLVLVHLIQRDTEASLIPYLCKNYPTRKGNLDPHWKSQYYQIYT